MSRRAASLFRCWRSCLACNWSIFIFHFTSFAIFFFPFFFLTEFNFSYFNFNFNLLSDENRDAYQDKAVVKTEKTTVKSENYAYQDYPKSYDAEAQQMASSCVYSPRPQAPPSQAMDQKQYIENTSFAGNHGVASSSSSSWCQGGQKRVNTPSNAAVQKNLNPYKKFKATTTTPN